MLGYPEEAVTTELKKECYGWYLALQHARVQLIKIDFRLCLVLADGPDTVELSIETPFRLIGLSTDVSCVPDEPVSLALVLPLMNAIVNGIVIKESGHISVEFNSGLYLKVDPDISYEAWQLGGSVGFLLVCPPEGGVSFF